MHNGRKAKLSGFTLIELLVVIAIIAILAAILFPIFQQAKETGRRATCANQMDQVNKGLLMYLQDSHDKFPPVDWGWRIGGIVYAGKPNNPAQIPPKKGSVPQIQDYLWKYVRNTKVWLCPSFKPTTAVTGITDWYWKDNRGEMTSTALQCYTNYLWNSPRTTTHGYVYMNSRPTSEIVRPSKAIMWYELPYTGPHLNANGEGNLGTGASNIAYFDGHVAFPVHDAENWWGLHSDDGWHM